MDGFLRMKLYAANPARILSDHINIESGFKKDTDFYKLIRLPHLRSETGCRRPARHNTLDSSLKKQFFS